MDDDPAGYAQRHPILVVLGLYVIGRLITFIAFGIAHAMDNELRWSTLTGNWDGAYYVDIARHGYPATLPARGASASSAFFPLYPLLIRGVSALAGSHEIAVGTVISLVCGAAATVVVLQLVKQRLCDRVALRAAILFCLFPGSVVFSMVYAEGLLVLLTALCLLALVRERWVLAGVAAALATATRPIALALVVACGWAAWRPLVRRRQWNVLAAPLLAPLGMAAYLAYLWRRTGNPRAWFIAEQRGWDQSVDFGRGFGAPLRHPTVLAEPVWLMYAGGFAILGICLFLAVRHRPRVPVLLAVYVAAVLAQCLLDSGVGPRPRFLLTAFPILLVPALCWRQRAFAFAVPVCLVLLGVLAAVYVTPRVVAP